MAGWNEHVHQRSIDMLS